MTGGRALSTIFVVAIVVSIIVYCGGLLGVGTSLWFGRSKSYWDYYAEGGSYTGASGSPAVSPDKQYVAYSSPRSGRGDIYRASIHLEGEIRLTASPDFEAQPSYSPDGQRIAYVRDEKDEKSALYHCNIWVMNSDGTSKARLTNGANDRLPKFSMDGTRIFFLRDEPSGGLIPHTAVWVVDVDGTHTRKLSGDAVAVSPDDCHYVQVDRQDERPLLTLQSKDGTTRDVGYGSCPSFSGDGRYLTWTTGYPEHHVKLMNLRTGTEKTFRFPEGVKSAPSLSHDGSLVAFVVGGEREVGKLIISDVRTGSASFVFDGTKVGRRSYRTPGHEEALEQAITTSTPIENGVKIRPATFGVNVHARDPGGRVDQPKH